MATVDFKGLIQSCDSICAQNDKPICDWLMTFTKSTASSFYSQNTPGYETVQ